MRLASFAALAVVGATLLTGCGADSTGPKGSISVVSGSGQSGPGGDDLPESLRVVVKSATGTALAGATVSWSVTAGGATVSPASSTTDANGETTALLSLGPIGAVSVTATGSGVTAATFTATATNPCAYLHAFGLAQTAFGKLRQYDCDFGDGSFVDFYGLPLTGQQSLSITLTANFDTYLVLFDLAADLVGVNDNRSPVDSTSRLKVLAAGGDYVVAANSYNPAVSGPYTLSAPTTTASEDNCEETWSTLGVSTDQVLSTSDCAVAGPFYSDTFLVVMLPGDSLDATVTTGGTFDAELQLHNGNSTLIASDDSVRGTHLTYTVTLGDVYPLVVTSMTAGAHGSYTLTLAAPPISAAIRTPRPLTLPRFPKRSLRAK